MTTLSPHDSSAHGESAGATKSYQVQQIPPANLAERSSPDLAPGPDESLEIITPEAVAAFVADRASNKAEDDAACNTFHDQPDPACKLSATNVLAMRVDSSRTPADWPSPRRPHASTSWRPWPSRSSKPSSRGKPTRPHPKS